jgi:hypothetical protein
MVVYHSQSLHNGLANGWSDEIDAGGSRRERTFSDKKLAPVFVV